MITQILGRWKFEMLLAGLNLTLQKIIVEKRKKFTIVSFEAILSRLSSDQC